MKDLNEIEFWGYRLLFVIFGNIALTLGFNPPSILPNNIQMFYKALLLSLAAVCIFVGTFCVKLLREGKKDEG